MYDINQRQDYQQNRIEHGIHDGQITRSEARRLEQGERAIDRAQRRAEADGHVTPQERARIDRMTDREGRADLSAEPRSPAGVGSRPELGPHRWPHDGWRDNGGRQDGWAATAAGIVTATADSTMAGPAASTMAGTATARRASSGAMRARTSASTTARATGR